MAALTIGVESTSALTTLFTLLPLQTTTETPHTHMANPEEVLETLRAEFASAGYSVFHPFAAEWYNQERLSLDDDLRKRLEVLPVEPWSGEDNKGTAAVLIGNNRDLWPHFMAHLKEHGVHGENPLDTYVINTVKATAERTLGKFKVGVKYFWSKDVAEVLLPMQRVAEVAGAAYRDLSTHLCLHPAFGAWFSMRCVLVLDISVPLSPAAVPLAPLVSEAEVAEANKACEIAVANTPAMDKQHTGRDGLGDHWRYWVALRDVVSLGKAEWRYSEPQIEYHYTKRQEVLLKLLEE